ncbi:glucan endo-1,3-beta-glucosidase 2 [Momordica charantia]|uniref:glucan endo-1,3-beta-D-glucosidase n=1 Tax=Momordica charantia TaxID=3673 RepID=A0A6J1DRP5_MOMCH|nr:glucan endo-1,3-beta-glucosidase 2 [Momordica charantia]
MPLRSIFLTISLSLYFLSLPHRSNSLTTIGATFSAATANTSHHLQPPDSVAKAINSLQLAAVRLEDSDPNVVRAFAYTNVTLLLTIPNFLVAPIAANRSAALRWLYAHVVPFYPRTIITTISVGNDFLEASPEFAAILLPAIRNVYIALRNLGIRQISVSTTFSFVSIMTTPFPPSAARFQEPVSQTVMRPLLQFLRDTNSSFLINIYPYNLYRLNSEIPIGYALFQKHPFNFRDDVITGVRYRNLFDSMVDAVISAMAVAGHEDVPVIVTETGWPSFGTDSGEVEANQDYAEMYLKGLIAHLKSGFGTPLRREGVMETYIYQLFDGEEEQGARPVRKWGLLYPNMTKKYDVVFSKSAGIGEQRTFLAIAAWYFGVLVLTKLW